MQAASRYRDVLDPPLVAFLKNALQREFVQRG
jgi:hypothetical protein